MAAQNFNDHSRNNGSSFINKKDLISVLHPTIFAPIQPN